MNHLSPFDRIALIGLGVIGLMIGFVVARGDTVGAQIQSTFPENDGMVSATGRIGITFKQAMQANSFSSRWEIQPALPGSIHWEGNTLWFVPSQAFAATSTYTFHLKPGGLSKDGRLVKQDLHLTIHTRPVQVLYLSVGDQKQDIWRQPLGGGQPVQLTFTGGNVYDFAPSPDGEQIAYAANNTLGGMDLWLIQRDGSLNHLLTNCATDQCIQAAWSPDGKQLVYNRIAAAANAPTSGAPVGLYSVDLNSGQSTFLFPGGNPSWSPDSQWLVSSDAKGDRLEAVNINSGEQIQALASVDETPTWFPDSSKMLYANLQTDVGIPQERLFKIDFINKKVSQILNDDVEQVEYTVPAISPDEKWMITSLHVMASGLSKQLWLMDVNGKNRKAITHDQQITNSYYSWDPWGSQVLYQQFAFGSSDALPDVMFWDRQTDQIKTLAHNAALPRWLP